MQIHQRIKDIREDHEKLQKEIADLLKTTQQQYSKYENGVQEIPVRHIITLSLYYKVSTDYLLGLTDLPTPPPKRSGYASQKESILGYQINE